MIILESNALHFDFRSVHPDAECSISFQRTLRLPVDDKTYPLPAGLGKFPLTHLDDFASKLPLPVRRRGGVLMPMWQSEAMWINFGSNHRYRGSYPFAVKIATGKINAVTGKPWAQELSADPQDYLVLPSQPWLDGYCVEKGKIRQFVAATLGDGQTVEEQLTGRADHGGIQIVVFPMKPAVYEERVARGRRVYDDVEVSDCYSLNPVSEMGLAAGGMMCQEIYEDEYGVDAWDQSNPSRVFVTILNAQQWHSVTGHAPQSQPIRREEYVTSGIPWFDWYSADMNVLMGSKILSGVKPINDNGSKGSVDIDPRRITPIGPNKRPVRQPDILINLADELRSTLEHVSALQKELDQVRTRLGRLLDQAQNEDCEAPEGSVPSHTKGPKTRLTVELDGRVIDGDVAADVFAEAVAEFGLGRVANSHAKLSGYPMVSRMPPPEDRGHRKIDGWYIVTHASNADKKVALERLASSFGVKIEVNLASSQP